MAQRGQKRRAKAIAFAQARHFAHLADGADAFQGQRGLIEQAEQEWQLVGADGSAAAGVGETENGKRAPASAEDKADAA